MSQRINTHSSSLVIFFSILTVFVQYLTYYFCPQKVIFWGVTCLIVIISCHVLLEQISTYKICFDYSFLVVFISILIAFLTYHSDERALLPFSLDMLGIAFLNWCLPMLFCYIKNMLNYGSKAEEFPQFYYYSSILFLVFYIIILIYGNFSKNAFELIYQTNTGAANFIPFEVISIQIEDYLYGSNTLGNIFIYLASRIFVFLPYGFYITLVLRRQNRLVRILSLLVLPCLLEVLQLIIIPVRCDIDDFIYAFIGGLLGCFFFFLTNIIFRAFSGRNFLSEDSYSKYSYPLYF